MSNKITRDKQAHAAINRPTRIPLGQGSKLSLFDNYATDKAKHYYAFLDKPGELEGAESAWYDFVKDDSGEKVKLPAGNGLTHYLMAIPKKLYDEDMANQQKLVTSTTRENVRINTGDSARNYSPEGHDAVVTRDM